MKSKITKPHLADCPAVRAVQKGVWDTPWYLPTLPNVRYLDRIGRKPGPRSSGVRWIELQCNATNCKAACVVLERDIARLGAGSSEDSNAR